jgi:hypothetical protein
LFDKGMGLQQGFDRFTDETLRPLHPLLGRQQWCDELQRAGLQEPNVVLREAGVAEFIGMDVIVAHGPSTVRVLDTARVEAALAQVLPAYMVPRHWMTLDALPLSANGKVDRKALPKPTFVAATAAHARLSPSTATEAQLVALWQEVLGLEDLSVDDSVFDRGADSLLATRAMARMRQVFSLPDLPLRLVFDHTSVQAQAREIDGMGRVHEELESFEL